MVKKINNKEAIANPESLSFFENLPQLKIVARQFYKLNLKFPNYNI